MPHNVTFALKVVKEYLISFFNTSNYKFALKYLNYIKNSSVKKVQLKDNPNLYSKSTTTFYFFGV